MSTDLQQDVVNGLGRLVVTIEDIIAKPTAAEVIAGLELVSSVLAEVLALVPKAQPHIDPADAAKVDAAVDAIEDEKFGSK